MAGQSVLKARTGDAAGGGINISADTVDIHDRSVIDSTTSGTGAAGAISLNAGTLRLNVNPDGSPIEGAETVFITSDSFSKLSTAGTAGAVTISGPGAGSTDAATLVALHDMQIRTEIEGGTAVTVPATITITADTMVLLNDPSSLNQMKVATTSSGPAPGGSIAFHVKELRANVNSNGTLIGDLDAPRSNIEIGSGSGGFLPTAGPAGSVTISGPGTGSTDAAVLVSLHGVGISTSIGSGAATNPPGGITITADTLALSGSSISGSTLGSAPGGDIAFHVNELRSNVNSNGTLIVGRNIQVAIGTDAGGAGRAGTVTISGPRAESTDAAKLVALHNTVIGAIVNDGAATNPPGSITITADTVALTSSPAVPGGFPGRTSIGVRTIASSPAGNITFNVKTLRANVDKTGQTIGGAPSVRIRTDAVLDTNTKDTHGDGIPDTGDGIPDIVAPGNAGTITIQGQAGSMASEVRLANTNISTLSGNGTQPGNILIRANVLDLRGGTAVLTNTIGTASAGTITLKAGKLTAAAALVSSSNGLDANSDGVLDIKPPGNARGGNVTIQAGDVILNPGTTLSAQSAGAGDAGSIFLVSRNNILMRNSTITTTTTEDQASGGNIKLTAPNAIFIADSTLTSSVKGRVGSNGGSISIDPIAVAIQNSRILAQANAGAGGNITVVASGVLVDPSTKFDATASQTGTDGTVDINAPIQVLGGTLVPLKVSYSQPALSGDRCAADPQGRFSSFVQTGRDGVPPIPGGSAPSPLLPLNRLVSNVHGAPGPRLAAARLGLAGLGSGASTQFQFHSGCRA